MQDVGQQGVSEELVNEEVPLRFAVLRKFTLLKYHVIWTFVDNIRNTR